MDVVEVDRVRKAYGDLVALDGVSVRVEAGAVLAVLGRNGAGKTTLVECLVGLRRPDAGTVRVLGLDPVRDADRVRRRVGVQLQEAALPDRMTVAEAVRVLAAAHGVPAEDDLLRAWGLHDKRRAAFAGLSGGQRQRLFVALALIGDPELVVLDELTTGLDPAARRDTWELVRALRGRGVTVVLVTHAVDEAEALCDRVVILDRGRVVADGTVEEIRDGHPTLEAAYLARTALAVGA